MLIAVWVCQGQSTQAGRPNPSAAMSSASLAIPTRTSSAGYSNRKWGRLREKLAHDKIVVDPDAGLHTLRHTFLTEAGEHTDAFTLQYIAGHDTIKTTMRYVHPRAESVSRAFGRINQNQKRKPAESA
jgi:integrase